MRWIQTTVTNLSFLKLWANVNLDQDLNFPFPTSPPLKWQFFAQLKLRYIGVLITKWSHLTAVIFFFLEISSFPTFKVCWDVFFGWDTDLGI